MKNPRNCFGLDSQKRKLKSSFDITLVEGTLFWFIIYKDRKTIFDGGSWFLKQKRVFMKFLELTFDPRKENPTKLI